MSSVSSLNSLLSSSTTSSATSVSSILAAIAGVSTPGIDVDSAVTAALYADRAQERIWQAEQTTLSSQTTALTSIQTATQALYSDFESLNSLSGPMASRSVTSTNSDVATASATTGTAVGTHTVTVSNLASTGSWYSDLATSATATLPGSSFTLTTASGSTASFTLGSGGVTNLTNLAASINNQSLGVTASVVSDSTGARLAIISNSAGAAGDFSITSSPTTATSWSSPTLATGQTLGADSFTLAMNGTTSTITTTDGETLSTLASSINSQNLGVTASVVSDTSGSHLSIVSTDGATPFTISEPAFGFSQAAAGADASFTVDGVPLTSASNTVTTAISGVTLNLIGVTTSSTPATLTVAANSSTISTALAQFVTDYNSAINLVNTQFSYSSSTSSQGALGSDPSVRSLQSALMSAMNYVNSSTSTSGTTISTLSSLGISTNTDGTLSLDTSTLSNELVNNPSGVQDFLMGSALNGFAHNMTSALSPFTNAGNGAFSVDLNSISKTNTDLTNQINDYENLYIANQKTLLTSMYSTAEAALQELPTQLKQIQAELGNTSSS